jgi:5-methylcytosine-specific restriction protein A
MSNARKSDRLNAYRTGYLKSVSWYVRRRAWFREEATLREGVVRCTICARAGSESTLELHHLEYLRVTGTSTGGWVSGEQHTDLVAVHPRCHVWIHQIIDRDVVLRGLIGRRQANLQAIARLRAKVAGHLDQLARP